MGFGDKLGDMADKAKKGMNEGVDAAKDRMAGHEDDSATEPTPEQRETGGQERPSPGTTKDAKDKARDISQDAADRARRSTGQ